MFGIDAIARIDDQRSRPVTFPRAVGRMVLTHVLNEHGTIEAETTVIRVREQCFYFVCAAFFELRLVDWLTQHRGAHEDVTVDNVSTRVGALAVQGLQSRNYGSFARNAMRMEKMLKGASELTNEVALPDADVMRFVKLDRPGGFIGRDATQRSLTATSRRWSCVYLSVDAADADCHGGEAMLHNGARVGAVSSGAFGHTVGLSLAFAYIDPAYAERGTELQVSILGEARAARVLDAPVYDPDNLRPRS
ncbi:MAG: hypothetical protein OEN20_02015 [Gammaproteobacteria bacterium]|nr:hypothetical protein [Gammaproteobacteria bacterium]